MPPSERPVGLTRTARNAMGRPRDARLPAPGTVLLRRYKGHVHQVEVLDSGIFYDGELYKSLSAVAHAITGGHWNGFLFFGLTDPHKENT